MKKVSLINKIRIGLLSLLGFGFLTACEPGGTDDPGGYLVMYGPPDMNGPIPEEYAPVESPVSDFSEIL